MYKVIMMDNYLDTKKLNIYEKTYETLEEAEEAYSEIFRQAKKLILEELGQLLKINRTQETVIQQIIDVVNEINRDEDIELNANEGRFLFVIKNCMEFNLAGKQIVTKIIQE